MKKMIGIIVLAIVLWLGATSYISSKVEPSVDKYISKINNIYDKLGIKYSAKIIEHSLFSSKIELTEEYTNPAIIKMMKKINMSKVSMIYMIEHGPVLIRNGFAIGMYRITNETSLKKQLKSSKELSKIFEHISEGDIQIHTDILVKLSENIILNGEISPFHLIKLDTNQSVSVGNTQISGDLSLAHDNISGTIVSNISNIEIKNSKNPKKYLKAKNTKLKIDISQMLTGGIFIGKIGLGIDKVDLASTANKGLEVSFVPSVYLDIQKNKSADISIEIGADYKHLKGVIPAPAIPVQKASSMLKIGGISTDAILAIAKWSRESKAMQSKILESMEANQSDPIAMANAMNQIQNIRTKANKEMTNIIKKLLRKDKTTISTAIKMSAAGTKESFIDAKIAYVGDSPKGDIQEVMKYLNKNILDILTLNAKMVLDKKLVSLSKDSSSIFSALEVSKLQGVVSEENDIYKTDISYKANSLKINGKDMSSMINLLKMMQMPSPK